MYVYAKTTGLWLIAVRQRSSGYGRVGFPFRVAEKPVFCRVLIGEKIRIRQNQRNNPSQVTRSDSVTQTTLSLVGF